MEYLKNREYDNKAISNRINELKGQKTPSFKAILMLHLIPGFSIFVFYLIFGNIVTYWGFPSHFALLLGFLFIGIPFQLGVLLYYGKQNTGKKTILGSIGYLKSMPIWQYGVIFVLLMGYAICIQVLLSPVAGMLSKTAFPWMPTFMQAQTSTTDTHVVRWAIIFTLILQLVLDGIVNPIVEEIYFRGFLLPHLAKLGKLAPLINVLLFTVVHLWQPHNYIIIFACVLPEVYLVWWKQNIRIAIMLHCSANLLGVILSLLNFFSV